MTNLRCQMVFLVIIQLNFNAWVIYGQAATQSECKNYEKHTGFEKSVMIQTFSRVHGHKKCCQLCMQKQTCMAWSFTQADVCHMYSSVSNKTRMQGWYSGEKEGSKWSDSNCGRACINVPADLSPCGKCGDREAYCFADIGMRIGVCTIFPEREKMCSGRMLQKCIGGECDCPPGTICGDGTCVPVNYEGFPICSSDDETNCLSNDYYLRKKFFSGVPESKIEDIWNALISNNYRCFCNFGKKCSNTNTNDQLRSCHPEQIYSSVTTCQGHCKAGTYKNCKGANETDCIELREKRDKIKECEEDIANSQKPQKCLPRNAIADLIHQSENPLTKKKTKKYIDHLLERSCICSLGSLCYSGQYCVKIGKVSSESPRTSSTTSVDTETTTTTALVPASTTVTQENKLTTATTTNTKNKPKTSARQPTPVSKISPGLEQNHTSKSSTAPPTKKENFCAQNPCFHSSMCLNVADRGYQCICAHGFTGDHCESALKPARKSCAEFGRKKQLKNKDNK